MRLLLLSLSFFLFLSCENQYDANYTGDSSPQVLGLMSSGVSMEDVEEAALIRNSSIPNEAPSQTQDLKIIKTGNLRFETQDLAKTHAQIVAAIKKAQGYVQNDNSGKSYNQSYQNITVRVPTRNFQMAIDDIANGVVHFDEKSISQKDVTEEFVDLGARLKAKRKLEERYLALLAKAKNVKEMLEIERELSKIRENIESAEGRMKYLGNKVSMSTIHIAFYKTTVETKITNSYGSKMLNALKSGWNGISQFFLGLLHVWPFLILVAIAVFVTRRLIKKKRSK